MVIFILKPTTEDVLCTVQVEKKIGGDSPNHAPYLLRTSPATIMGEGRPYGIPLLCKLSLIVKADWMSGGHPTQVEPSKSSFPRTQN